MPSASTAAGAATTAPDSSTNDECGLLVEGFDTPPVLMMPHNPRYYPPLLESAGLVKVKDLLAYQSEATALPARLVDRLVARRFGLEPD